MCKENGQQRGNAFRIKSGGRSCSLPEDGLREGMIFDEKENDAVA